MNEQLPIAEKDVCTCSSYFGCCEYSYDCPRHGVAWPKGGAATVADYTTKRRWQNRVRWSVAYHLNRLPWTCWANIVSWAMRSRPTFSRDGDGDIRQDYMCRTATDCGRCYCGKIAVPTRILPPATTAEPPRVTQPERRQGGRGR